jgi:hypothetical protein
MNEPIGTRIRPCFRFPCWRLPSGRVCSKMLCDSIGPREERASRFAHRLTVSSQRARCAPTLNCSIEIAISPRLHECRLCGNERCDCGPGLRFGNRTQVTLSLSVTGTSVSVSSFWIQPLDSLSRRPPARGAPDARLGLHAGQRRRRRPLEVALDGADGEGQLRDVAAYTLTLVPALAAPSSPSA